MRERYSFTQLKNVDWDALSKRYREKAEEAGSPDEFSRAIVPMLAQLKDVHVWIEKPDGYRVYPHRSGATPNYDHPLITSQLKDVEDFGFIGLTGRTKNNIGVAIVKSLPANEDFQPLIDSIRELEDTQGFIVDLRANHGGSENQAAKVAGLFANERTRYARSLVRAAEGGMREAPARFLEPNDKFYYKGPVVCLIGPRCVSSGEGFALMMKALDRVQVVGLPTRGASGNPSPVTLSNGIRVWFSRWVALELDGTPIEGVGIQPEILVEHRSEGDPAFDKALDLLR